MDLRRLLFWIICITYHGDLCVAQHATPEHRLQQQILIAKTEFRKAKCEQFGQATHVFISLLDFNDILEVEPLDDSEQRFELSSKKYVKILKEVELAQDSKAIFLKELSDTILSTDSGTGALCHYPTHAVQVVLMDSNGKKGSPNAEVVFQCSLSIHCRNIVFPYPFPLGADAIGTKDSLHRQLLKVMPYPVDEMRRFEVWREGNR